MTVLNIQCAACAGTGADLDDPAGMVADCDVCAGSGLIRIVQRPLKAESDAPTLW